MPIYTFRCLKCKHKFSDFFSVKQADGKNVVCPKCKGKKVARVWEGTFFSKKSSTGSTGSSCSSCPSCPLGSCNLK